MTGAATLDSDAARDLRTKGRLVLRIGLALASIFVAWLWLWLAVNHDPSSLFGIIEAPGVFSLRSLVFDVVVFGGLALLGVGFALGAGTSALSGGEARLVAALWGFACGFGGMLVVFAVVLIAGHARPGGEAGAGALVIGVLAALIQSGGEEVFFRGWLQRVLVGAVGGAIAVAATALAFGLLHLVAGWEGPVALLNMILGGVWLGLLALRTGGLAAPIAAHFAWNATEALVLGLVPNPGVTAYGAFLDFDIAAGLAWGGGEAGLNTSPVQSVVLIVLIAATLPLRRTGDADEAY